MEATQMNRPGRLREDGLAQSSRGQAAGVQVEPRSRIDESISQDGIEILQDDSVTICLHIGLT